MGKFVVRVVVAVLGIALLVRPEPARLLGPAYQRGELMLKAAGAALLFLAVLPYGKPRNRVAAREGHPEDEL